MSRQRVDLRTEREAAVRHCIVKRLLADAVARNEQAIAGGVPDREREHPAQLSKAARTISTIQSKDHLGISIGPESVATPLAFPAQLLKVVDLAIEHDAVARFGI